MKCTIEHEVLVTLIYATHTRGKTSGQVEAKVKSDKMITNGFVTSILYKDMINKQI